MNKEYLQFKKKNNPPKYNREKPPQVNFDDFPSYDMGGPNNDDEAAILDELDRYDNTPLFPDRGGGKKDGGVSIPDPIRIDSLKVNSSVKIQIRDVTVYFPFQPYDCQVAYMTSVIDALNGKKNALLQSPTGTGKTLCLLCATLAWVNKYREGFTKLSGDLEKYKPIKIYYSTRTHSQIKQVVKELKQTCYRPVTSILGSRNQLCVRPDFSELVGFQLNSACKAARTTNIPEQRCYYYDNFMRNKNTYINQNRNNISDIEELVSSAKKSRFCPYFLEREIKQRADLIFLPYNYLLDSKIRETMEVNVTDSIVIFDEAHNVESLAEEGSSFTISVRELENCELDFKLLRQKMRNTPEDCKITEQLIKALEYPIYSLGKNMTRVKKELEKEFKPNNNQRFGGGGNEDNNKRGKVCAGREIFDIFKGMTFEKTTQTMFAEHEVEFKSGLDISNFPKFIAYLQVAVDELANVATSKGGLDTMHNVASRVYNLLKLDLETKNLGTNKDWSRNFIDSYVLYIHFDEDYSNFHFSLWCLNPGVGFSAIKDQKPLNILLTSGTLTPLKSFESELLIDFPVQLINNHVIDTKNQCYTVVLRKGPANYPLNFSYDRRNDVSVYNEMGTTLINIARLVPNGILVCFASYGLMQKCFEIWQSQDQRILARLEELKKIYKEPKKATQLKLVMSEYMKDAKTKGAILCCVCRGKVSEGIDFADEMARAVVVIGVPFPPTADVKVQHKKRFLDENKSNSKRLNGNEWYMQQTIRACNQAIGRVIRHVNDYGLVFLCDERFSSDQFKNEFPNWIKENLEVTDKFGFMVGKVATFFKDRNKPAALNKLISKAKAEIVVPVLPTSHDNFNTDPVPFEDKRSAKSVSVQSKNPLFKFEEEEQPPVFENRERREIRSIQKPSSQNPLQNFRHMIEEKEYTFDRFKVKTLSPIKDVSTTTTKPMNMTSETRSFHDVLEAQRKKTAEPQQFGLKRIKLNDEPANMGYIEPTPIPEEPSFEYENSMSMTGAGFRRGSDSMHSMNSMNSNQINNRSERFMNRTESNPSDRLMQRTETNLTNFSDRFTPRMGTNRAEQLMPMEEEEEEEDKVKVKENFTDILTRPNKPPSADINNALARLLSADSVQSEVETQLIPETLEKSEPRSLEPDVRDINNTVSSLNINNTVSSLNINNTVSSVNTNNTGSSGNAKSEGTMSVEKTGAMCIMCYEKKSEDIMTSACGHLACNKCWENWLAIKSECPTCKKKVRAKQLIKIHF